MLAWGLNTLQMYYLKYTTADKASTIVFILKWIPKNISFNIKYICTITRKENIYVNIYTKNIFISSRILYLNVYWEPNLHQVWLLTLSNHTKVIPWVAAQVVRWSGIPVDACSSLGWCSKSCDLSAAELRGYRPWSWGVRPVNCIYRLWRHCP